MKLNGIMRLRLVGLGIVILLFSALWAPATYSAFQAVNDSRIEMEEACQQPPEDLTVLSPSEYCEFYTRMHRISVSSYENYLWPWSLLVIAPGALYWLIGSIIGWVYRGFKQSQSGA